jgi:hippurate hydrolase
MKRSLSILTATAGSFLAAAAFAADGGRSAASAKALASEVQPLYIDLHQHPELSLHEERTAKVLAERLRALGFAVTERVGGTGVVGVLKNGPGPTVMLRTELDALPVEEKTGLAYASRVRTKNDQGAEVAVMHACGHDVHMAVWTGTAISMSREKAEWSGTLVLIAQPAEERAMGAKAMLADGLLTRFPRPDVAFALHDIPTLPSGTVGFGMGSVCSSADSVDLIIYGKGGHGAAPQTTVDPVVIAARTILALQTIVSRETNPLDPAIVTVGSIHGGSKHNIIPDEVKLQITVRSFKDDVRAHTLAAIDRIAKAEAAAAGSPREPEMKIVESCPVTVNDARWTPILVDAIRRELGPDHVIEIPPETASEDFSEFARAGVPSVYVRLGAAEPGVLAAAKAAGRTLPSLHSSFFAPDRDATIETGIRTETAVLMELLKK